MSDRARGFPAFPPSRGRARRGQSWWARAWVSAMEESALDPEPLRKGRAYARTGLVGTITVSPGRIAASVQDADDASYHTVVAVEQLTDADWERFLDEVAAKAGHIAALLDKDMPHDLVEAASYTGLRLLPGLGDLDPTCDCSEWEHPCKHAAALCYQASWLLDRDPFVLLLMRGRGERELLDDLQARNAQLGERTWRGRPELADQASSAGTPAVEAYAQGVRALPDMPPVSAVLNEPAFELAGVAPAAGVDPEALKRLAADAAARALELLTAGPSEVVADLDVWQDSVRIAATFPDERLVARLAQESGQPARFARAVQAWTYGGRVGLDVLESAWTPPKADLARARAALVAGWDGDELPELVEWRNRWTSTSRGVQLRYGRDGRWYPFREESGEWWPAGLPDADPAAAIAELLGA